MLFDGVLAHTRELVKIPDVEEVEITYRKLPQNEEEAKLPFGDPHGDGVPPMPPLFGHGYFTHVTVQRTRRMAFVMSTPPPKSTTGS